MCIRTTNLLSNTRRRVVLSSPHGSVGKTGGAPCSAYSMGLHLCHPHPLLETTSHPRLRPRGSVIFLSVFLSVCPSYMQNEMKQKVPTKHIRESSDS